ncbi:hypothetical protein AC249_AIPGENE12752 [Exaiptasia diaphana]|nr:hypothetical protein AC249_AIPGENE12752 [Exaiptasia diaphana]
MKFGFVAIVVFAFYITRSSSITCQRCKDGLSYEDCLSKAENYDCNRLGPTYSYCSIECNKGEWKFGCATPTRCSIQRRHCHDKGDCGITCCTGSLCIAFNNITHNPCSGNVQHHVTPNSIGLCLLVFLYIGYML